MLVINLVPMCWRGQFYHPKVTPKSYVEKGRRMYWFSLVQKGNWGTPRPCVLTWISTKCLEHSWVLKSETVSFLCLGGGEDGQTFSDRRWGGLALKGMQTSVTQLPAERRGSAVRQLVEKQVRRRFPDSSAVILLWILVSSVNLPFWKSLFKVSLPHVPKIVLDKQHVLLVKPFWLLS